MRDIKAFTLSEKYSLSEYVQVRDGIYRHNGKYVTALSFCQEPELNEGLSASDISQYPLEDILDKYHVYVSDFFEFLNTATSQVCYLEFTGFSEEDVFTLQSLIGRHVYCREVHKNNENYAELVIE